MRTAASVVLSLGISAMAPDAGVNVQTAGREFYVAPNGSASNDGSISRPLDLATALSRSSPAKPGDTIWLRGGVYRGSFWSYLTGTSTAPIIVRQYPDERATIDSNPQQTEGLLAFGAYTWYWGFEIMNSDPTRSSSQTGSWPYDVKRGYGVTSRGRALKFINLVVHDMTNGFGIWTDSVDTEAYGNIVYYNGWQAPDRAHGHGIYSQNQSGNQRIIDNIAFNQFSHGFHSYGSEVAFLDNITLEGNIAFNNGMVSKDGPAREILLGGGTLARNPVVRDNSTYGAQVNFGYSAGCSNADISGNYLAGSGVFVVNCQGVIRGNSMYSFYGLQSLPTALSGNTFYGTEPTGVFVRVRPNQYEPGRAHIAVYNWDSQPQVSVDLLPAGLAIGQSFEIRDAQNYFGAPVLTGVFDGSRVNIPMTSTAVSTPVGAMPVAPRHTDARFGAFVVVPVASDGGAVLPSATLSVWPATIASGGSVTLSWTTSNAARVQIDPLGLVSASGSMTVSPSQTTTYILTATSAAGDSVSRTGTATVTAASVNTPPVVALTAPRNGSKRVAPETVALAANASDSDGTVAGVAFHQNGVLLGIATVAPYNWVWSAPAAGTYALTAVATDDRGASTTSAAALVTITAGTVPTVPTTEGPNTAKFVRLDTTTRGGWKGVYGAQAFTVINDFESWPAYASLTPEEHTPWTWMAWNLNDGALLRARTAGRIASAWYSSSGTFSATVGLTDGLSHQLALYCLDYDNGNRAQTIEILDAGSGAVLDRRYVKSFAGGQYLVWRVTGAVRVRFKVTAGPNPVVSGLFLDR